MNLDTVFANIKQALTSAPRNDWTAELHLQIIKYADAFRNLAANYLGDKVIPEASFEPGGSEGDPAPLLPLDLPAEASYKTKRRNLRVVGR